MASPQEQQIETIFQSFDKDKNGTIELSELREVAEALGEKIPEDQLSDILMNLDTNGDGKISLEQFKFWWLNGLKGKMGKLVFLKAKSMKMTQQFLGQFEKAGVDLSSFSKESDIDMMSFSLSCGESVEDAMQMDATIIHRGDRFKWAFKELKEEKGVSWLNQKSVNIVLILPSNDPAQAKEQLTALLKQVSDSGKFPFLEGGDQNPLLGIKFEPLQSKLVLHVELKEPLLQLFAEPIGKFDSINSLFDESFYFYLEGSFSTNFSIDDLLDGSNLIETLLKGFYFHISGEAPNCVIKKYRELLEASGKVDGSMKFLLSVLMKNAFVKLKLKSPQQTEKFFQKLGIKDILKECPNLSDLLEQLALVPEVQEMKFGTDSPKNMMYQVLRCLKENVCSGIELYLQRGESLVKVCSSFPGTHKLFNVVFNEV